MMYSKLPFVSIEANDDALAKIEPLLASADAPVRLLIQGEKGSGKTTLLTDIDRRLKEAKEEAALVCSGADVSIAYTIKSDDEFLEKLGSAPTLLMDNVEFALGNDEEQNLIALMINERDRQHLNTIMVTDTPLADLDINDFARKALESLDAITIIPLDDAGRIMLVDALVEEFGSDKSATLSDDAKAWLAAQEDFTDIENAVKYLMINDELFGQTLDKEKVCELIVK